MLKLTSALVILLCTISAQGQMIASTTASSAPASAASAPVSSPATLMPSLAKALAATKDPAIKLTDSQKTDLMKLLDSMGKDAFAVGAKDQFSEGKNKKDMWACSADRPGLIQVVRYSSDGKTWANAVFTPDGQLLSVGGGLIASDPLPNVAH